MALTEEQEKEYEFFQKIRKEKKFRAAFSVIERFGVNSTNYNEEVPDFIGTLIFEDWVHSHGDEYPVELNRKPTWFQLWELHNYFLISTENERHIYFEGYEPDDKGRPNTFKVIMGS